MYESWEVSYVRHSSKPHGGMYPPVIPVLRRWMQEDFEFEASLGYNIKTLERGWEWERN
jgi:hypothetical protein